MNKCDKTEEKINRKELDPETLQNSSRDIEFFSDCGDDFCECSELCVRPSSRDIHSEEEFEDAVADSGSKVTSVVEIPLKVSPLTKCDESIREESILGLSLETPKNDGSAPNNAALSLTSKNLKFILGLREDSGTSRASKRLKKTRGGSLVDHCNSGKGDARTSIAERLRCSFSRIPVANGRSIRPMTKPSGSRGSQTSEGILGNIVDEPSITESKIDVHSEAAIKDGPLESDVLEDDDLFREDVILKNEVMEKVSSDTGKYSQRNDTPPSESEPIRTNSTEEIDKDHSNEPNQPTLLGSPTQEEVVVLTLAEERLRNQKFQNPEDQKKAGTSKPGSRSTPRSEKRLLEGNIKDIPRGVVSASHRLNALIKDRSGQALMKPDQVMSRENSRSSTAKSLRLTSGRQSASSEPERTGNRLQAIRLEKAQIRQRIEAKPIAPSGVKRVLGTPTMKQPLTNPLTTSLKRDIAYKRPTIERMAREAEGGRNTGVTDTASKVLKAVPISKEVESSRETEKGEEQLTIADTASKVENTLHLKQPSKVQARPISIRTSKTAGDMSVTNAKAELCSLSAKYQARLKKYEAQKKDMTKTQKELSKTVAALNQLRESIRALSGDDPGELEMLQVVAERPDSSHVHASSSMERVGVAESSTSISGRNHDSSEDKSELLLCQLESDKSELTQTTEILKKENDSLRKQERDRSERELVLKKDLLSIQNSLKESEKRAKELELKIAERETALAQLRGNVAKMQDLSDKLKQKDNQIVSLRRQFAEESKEHNMQLKKALDAKETIREDLMKEREHYQSQIKKLKEENDFLKLKQEESNKMVLNIKDKNSELQTKIEKEMKKTHDLEAELMNREKYIINLERKIDDKENSSSSILGLSEQLMQKDLIISELEKHRAGVQSQNREMCTLLSSTFKLLGQEMGEDEIESSLTGGRMKFLQSKLSQLINVKSASWIDNKKQESSIEYEKKILQLEDQVAVLEAELQESKTYSETLAGIISDSSPWNNIDESSEPRKQLVERDGSEGDHPTQLVKSRNGSPCILPTPPISLGTPNNGHINEIRELFISLESKRQALMRMERKMQELEEIHANCAQKRVRNEIRIDQLEMMLASYKE